MEQQSSSLVGTWIGDHASGLSSHLVTLKETDLGIRGRWVIGSHGEVTDVQDGQTGRQIEVAIEGQEVSAKGFRFAWGGGDSPSMEFRLLGEGRAVMGPILSEAERLLPAGTDIGRVVEGHRVYLTRRESNAR